MPCHRISRSRAQAKSLKCPRHASVDMDETDVQKSDDIRVVNVLEGDGVEGDTEIADAVGGVCGGVAIQGAQ